jgi:CheY-like chemotaxis protein
MTLAAKLSGAGERALRLRQWLLLSAGSPTGHAEGDRRQKPVKRQLPLSSSAFVAIGWPQCIVRLIQPGFVPVLSKDEGMAAQAQPRTQAKRILVVEDELMIRLLLEDMLSELGYIVAAEAARMDEALEATKNADFDLAILDANLNGEPISPVADVLIGRGTPFVFATGYGEMAEPYRDRPTLMKPFRMDGLKQVLQSTLDSGS